VATDYTVRHQGNAKLSAASCDFAPIRDQDGVIVGAVVILRRTEPGGAAQAQAASKKHLPAQDRFGAARHDRTMGTPRAAA